MRGAQPGLVIDFAHRPIVRLRPGLFENGSAVNACVRDIRRNLPKRCVLQRDGGHRDILQRGEFFRGWQSFHYESCLEGTLTLFSAKYSGQRVTGKVFKNKDSGLESFATPGRWRFSAPSHLSRNEGKRWAQEALLGDSSRAPEANTPMLVGSLRMM